MTLSSLPTAARSLVLDMVVSGNPIPWRRVRRGAHGKAYVPNDVVAEEQRIGLLARAAGCTTPARGPMRLELAFFRSTRHHVDGSNLQKLVEDAFNEVVWKDDSQVVEWVGTLGFDKDNPRTEVKVWKLVR